jgi:D-amino-acid dehydrogenase
MSSSRTPDVAIIGGGAVGLMTALELARRGARPVLLERSLDFSLGCTSGSAGLLSPGHSAPLATPQALRQGIVYMFRRDSPFSMRPRPRLIPWLARFIAACRPERVRASTRIIQELSLASLEMHAALAAEGLDTGFARRGAINVYETESAFEAGRREAAALAEDGIKSEVLETSDARELEPSIGDVAGAVFYPDEAHCSPERFLAAAADAARDSGAELRTGVEVTRLRRKGRRIQTLETTAGDLMPERVVIAAGVWSSAFARQVGVRIPVEGGKGYHVDLEATEADPRIPIYLHEARVIATRLDGVLRLAGTLQLTGLDESIDDVRVRATLDSGVRALRHMADRRMLGVWRGIRPCTPDGLPIVGVPRSLENAVLATGHAMKGLHLAPITGRLVTELLASEPPSYDLTPMHPDRFAWPLRRRRPGIEEPPAR